jgi:cysteine desulfurase family protein (TIGR01976 family)
MSTGTENPISPDALVDVTAAELRAAIRTGRYHGPTAGLARGYVQANLVLLPADAAAELAEFCRLNPRPCPLLEQTPPGDPEPRQTAPGADLRTDVPRYRVFRSGVMDSHEPHDIRALWRDDLVGFLLGCSFTFENALLDAGLPVRHIQQGCNVPMYRTNRPCTPAGRFSGVLVVSMRPYPPELVDQVVAVTNQFAYRRSGSVGHRQPRPPRFRRPRRSARRGTPGILGLWRNTPGGPGQRPAGTGHHAQPRLHVCHGLARRRSSGTLSVADHPHSGATLRMSTDPFPIDWCRSQFPALSRKFAGLDPVFLDGPAGSQVPARVIDAIGHYLVETNANHGGRFPTSRASDAMLDEAHRAVADLLGAPDPASTIFGANMTTLTLAFSRALSRSWGPGDEIIVTRLDHDANVRPWVLAAEDAGATVHFVPFKADDCTLDLDVFRERLSPRTRLVAVGCASNAVGTINPIDQICRWAHEAGSQVYVDAVHYAPHGLIDVAAWDCDYLACSAYKFFGPHVGILWGKRELLESLTPYKVRPAADVLPDRWMTGTQNHECIAGVLAAIDYLADLGRQFDSGAASRRAALERAFTEIGRYERTLCEKMLHGLSRLANVRIWGITDGERLGQRVPTVSITHRRRSPIEVVEHLAQRGIFAWHGNFYALEFSESLGLEPEGLVRLGLLHYNTAEEVERLLAALAELD